jgi:hypothetical protein
MFEDIVPIIIENESGQLCGNNSADFMEFEAIDVLDDEDQAGQGQRAPDAAIKDQEEYSQRVSSEEELNLTKTKGLFQDISIKSSRRYNNKENAYREDEDDYE